jgi:hypothetical protein
MALVGEFARIDQSRPDLGGLELRRSGQFLGCPLVCATSALSLHAVGIDELEIPESATLS